MSYSVKLLQENLDLFELVLVDIERAWSELGNENSIRTDFESKFKLLDAGAIRGVILVHNDLPVGVAWFEIAEGDHYGSALFHAVDKDHRNALVQAFVETGWSKGFVFEIIQFDSHFDFRDALIHFGLLEKERQRMKIDIPSDYGLINAKPGITYTPLNESPADILGQISASAHGYRQKIEGYHDFATPENRAEMESKLRTDQFGKMVPSACKLMSYNGDPIGTITVIELTGWGYDRIAWIMDVAIRPDMQGFGYGGDLVQRATYGAKQAGIPAIGLGVTVSNQNALRLYEKLGFKAFDYFVEFIDYRV
ncbi:MAG: GNAT family N-acetyltransferase [bacterium]|nr:GNAT family N-acetyltransferase [bacterium]